MSIIVKVRGVDDFGKEPINSRLSRYSQHYPRPKVNDIMVYYIPKGTNGPSVGIYQVKEETEYYYKDGFQYCTGTMTNLVGTGSPNAFLIKLMDNPKHNKLGKELDKVIYDLGLKHNPELYDENGKARS